MNAAPPSLRQRFGEIRDRIALAARRSGRNPEQVVLVGAVKTVALDRIREALALGLADLGENRVQEAAVAFEAVGGAARWHMIGHLQRNKAGRAADMFDRIHSLDDLEVARAVSRRALAGGRTLKVMVQVNVSGESQKHGVAPDAAPALVAAVAELPALELDGLMAIGAATENADEPRREFAAVRVLRDRCERESGVALPQLSMGMSGDFEVAIEEGSTLVRIGTALFGER